MDECDHMFYDVDGYSVCFGCGVEKFMVMSHVKMFNDHCSSTSILVDKVKDKGFYEDIGDLYLSEPLKLEALSYFVKCSEMAIGGPRVFRSKLRRSIIFACVYLTCVRNRVTECRDNLARHFQLELKDALEGMRIVKMKVPVLRMVDEDTYYFINTLCRKLRFPYTQRVLNFYDVQRSSIRKYSGNHEVVAAVMVYMWIITEGSLVNRHLATFPMVHFCTMCGLSYTTVFKLYRTWVRVPT
jgi:hypothetical protein